MESLEKYLIELGVTPDHWCPGFDFENSEIDFSEAPKPEPKGKTLTYLVLHCTATPRGRWVDGKEVISWHTEPLPKGRGWSRPGYTDLILLDGTIERLWQNDEDGIVSPGEITNGAKGINSISRHIAYVGGVNKQGKPEDTRTPGQKETMKEYVLDFITKFPHIGVAGHNYFAAKACPSFSVPEWLLEIGAPERNIVSRRR